MKGSENALHFEPPAGRATHDPGVMQRMAQMEDLFQTALLMIRQNVLRRNPEAGEEEIDDAIRAWLDRCPGAEHGDGEGRPSRRLVR